MQKHQRGMSLVEIMIALIIGLFLIGGVVQMYVANRSTYHFTNAISRVQENGRFALDYISEDLRMAGFWGCTSFDPADTSNIVNHLDTSNAAYSAQLHDFLGRSAVEGQDNVGASTTDTLTLRGSKVNQASVLPPYNSLKSANIRVTKTADIEAGDIVIISNCEGADIFQVSTTGAGGNASQMALIHNAGAGTEPGNANGAGCSGSANCLSQTYGADAAVVELQTVTYSIASGANGQPALWRSENGVNQELIGGVENFQVLYGVDTDNDQFANQYVVSTAVADMNQVIALRVMLLVRSEDDFVTEGNQSYTFNGNTVTANDRRLRQVFSSTIGLRNRIGT
jgi:type IV pilus assembly protein PilW